MKRAKLIATAALLAGAALLPAPSEAVPCPTRDLVCLAVYDPVICLNGRVYSNQCYALRACAVGCVPYQPVAGS